MNNASWESEDDIWEEPEGWFPPVTCPQCGSTETLLVSMNYEASVYVCEQCDARFELEQEGGGL